jgi:hypothetical protein
MKKGYKESWQFSREAMGAMVNEQTHQPYNPAGAGNASGPAFYPNTKFR